MDDLDELLAGLDKPRASTRSKQRTPSAVVNYDELNELMLDLASPPEAKPAQVHQKPSSSATSYSSSGTDGLDDLLGEYPQPVRSPQQPVRNAQQPVRNTQQPVRNTQQPVRNTQSAVQLDDLDELLRNLGPPSATHAHAPVERQTPVYNTANNQSYDRQPQVQNNSNNQSYDRQPQVQNSNTQSYDRQPQVQNSNNQSYDRQPQVQNNSNQAYDRQPQGFNSNNNQSYDRQPQAPASARNVVRPVQQPAMAKPAATKPAGRVLDGPDLDVLLADINKTSTRDLDRGGPASRGDCAHCRKPILGEVIQALNHTYHPEHFMCGNCNVPLGTSNFYEQDGVPNCERCYQELFCSRCAHCDEPITGRCITALNRKWHSDHFICGQCLGPFPGGTFFEKEGRPYCENCFHNAFSSRCAGCNQSIKGECINALGQQWHPEHFVCQYCQKSFGSGSFYEYGGKPYCETHYHQQTGSLCAGCGKAVTGRMINALDKKWHPEHFVCSFCMQPLAGGAFTENSGKAYCKECHGKLFG